MISHDEAKNIIDGCMPKRLCEKIKFDRASGRIISEDIFSTFPQPRFDNSAMDGFAVRWKDTVKADRQEPVTLKMTGVSAAGNPAEMSVTENTCIQIMTGARIPEGADAVIMVENTSGFESKSVKIYRPAKRGENIRFTGEELPGNKLLIPGGTRISPSETGILATFGIEYISVYKKPVISVFGLGDELIEPGNPLSDGKIYNSNLHVLNGLLQESGGSIYLSTIIKDNPDEIELWLSRALKKSDIIISSAGISMGKFDYAKSVFRNLGIEEKFWQVAQKPGKPLFFGTRGKTLIFGLPGNPVSSYIGYLEYIHPVIKKFMGEPVSPKIKVPLSGSFPVEKNKYRFMFGSCKIENGKFVCVPSSKMGSHMLTASLGANCIIESPPSSKPIQDGEKVTVNLLTNFRPEVLFNES